MASPMIVAYRHGCNVTICSQHALLKPTNNAFKYLVNRFLLHHALTLTAQEGLAEKIKHLPEVPRKLRDTPFVQIPLGVTEDRLVGTVDIEASMKEGKTVFQPGTRYEG